LDFTYWLEWLRYQIFNAFYGLNAFNFLIPYVLIAMIGAWVGLVILIVWKRHKIGKKGHFRYEIVIKDKGLNHHIITRNDKLNFTFKPKNKDLKGKTYEIKSDNLYHVKRGPLMKLMDSTFGVYSRFLIVFQSGKQDPIAYSEPTRTPTTLRVVSESTALKQALKDEFAKALNVKWIFIIFLLLCVGVLAYFFMTGQITF